MLIGVGGLLALLIVAFALRGQPAARALPIAPGARVAEIEAALAREAGALPPGAGTRPALPDPSLPLRERAKELATKDPARAASILKAWMASEQGASKGTPHA